MSNEMAPKDAELYRRVKEITHYMWDPLDVRGVPEAHNEYDSYLMGMYGRVQTGKIDSVIKFMMLVATENMGMSFDLEKATQAAEAMISWKNFIDEDT